MGNLAMSDQRVSVEMVKDSNGLDKVVLKEPRGASAQVHLFGGHVTSWRNERGEELLFMSSKAIFKPPKAIRGGIPICFPQFGSCGSLEQHGFARNRFWSIDSNPPPLPANSFNNKAVVDLILKPTEEDLKIWPHCFEFRLRVALAPGGDLTLVSRIRNTDSKPFAFTFAYHTYFSVSDIRCDLRIVSDANSFFIKTILENHDLLQYFTEIQTNPASVDENGRLRISPFHSDTAVSHGCKLCPHNMCKGAILDGIKKCSLPESTKCFIYLGDGRGDFCPSLKLGAKDHVLARRGYPLWELLHKNSDLVKAEVHGWSNAKDVEDCLCNLLRP